MANHPRTGAPTGDPPKQTRFRPPAHDSAQDDARAFQRQVEQNQTIRTGITSDQPLEMENPADLKPDDPGSL